jgi:hypothetical protein
MEKKRAKGSFWFGLGSFLLLLTLILPFLGTSNLGIAISLFLSWYILLLSFQEESSFRKTILARSSELEKEMAELIAAKESIRGDALEKESAHKIEKADLEKKMFSLQKALEEKENTHKTEIADVTQKTLFLQEALKEKEALILGKEKEIVDAQDKIKVGKELLDHLNQKRMENFQLSLLNDTYSKQIPINDIEIKNLKEMIETMSEEDKLEAEADLQLERDYKQLKKQFEEKSEILNQTRKALFQLEGRLLVFQKERENKETEVNPAEVLLANHLKEVEEECIGLELEVAHLQEFISKLLAKKSPGRKKKEKSTSSPDLELNF